MSTTALYCGQRLLPAATMLELLLDDDAAFGGLLVEAA
jgi:hypothetical protein